LPVARTNCLAAGRSSHSVRDDDQKAGHRGVYPELIAVSSEIEEALTLYARQHTEDAYGIERVLRFRQSGRRGIREPDTGHYECDARYPKTLEM
jgi:hypothetical protein